MLSTKLLYIKVIYVILIIGLFHPCFCYSQNSSIRFLHYTSSEGLSQNMVDCILKDSKGYMWFGTWNGLNKFDGYEFTIFKHTNDQNNTIADNFVYCIEEDTYGNIWLGTKNGLTVFNYEKNEFVNYRHVPDSGISIVANTINDIVCDKKGFIWLATTMGVNRLKINSEGKIENIQYLPSEPNNILCLHFDSDENLWIGTNEGLYYLDKNHQIKNYILPITLTNNNINTIYTDSLNYLWFGTNFGLIRFNKKTNEVVRYNVIPDDPTSIVHDVVTSITEDIRGNLLFGTLGGLCIYNREKDNFKRYTHQPNVSHCLNNNFVNCLLADEKGNIWIGTERGGINKYTLFQNKFESLEQEPGNPNSLNQKTVNSILEDDRYVWIGTAGGGLNRYEKKTGTFKHFIHQSNNSFSLGNDFIPALLLDKNDNLWIGSWGGGLHKLTPENKNKGHFIHYRQDASNPNGLINNFIATLQQDKYNNIWIGTLGGINRLNPKTGEFEIIPGNNNVGPIHEVGTLFFDKWGNLWIGSIQGLYKIKADSNGQISSKNDNITYFTSDPNNDNSLSGNYVTWVCGDKNNDIWVGTYGAGLNKFKLDKTSGEIEKIIRFDEGDGISNNVIYTILEDNSGILWMSTDNGLTRFNPKTRESHKYMVENGLLSNQFYWSAAYKNEDGKLYFGGMNGLNSFFPDSIYEYTTDPKVVITDFKIYNNSVEVGKKYNNNVVLEKSISVTEKVVLSYKLNEFAFEFSALDYNQPEKYLYAYRMLNFEDKWTFVNAKRRFANYTNLAGGEYIFQVKAANNIGKWDTQTTSLILEIIPPFWAKWWFRISLILIIIASVLLYIYIRTYNLTKQKQKLELLVTERTAKIEEQKEELLSQANHLQETNVQLEKRRFQIEVQNEEILTQRDKLIELNKKIQLINQQRLRFFTQISHEFRTPLTLILSPLEKLLGQLKNDLSVKEKLSMINKNVQRLLHLINQLMEIRKFETGNVALKTNLNDIVVFVDNIANTFKDLAQQRNINLEITHGQKEIAMCFDEDKIENIIYNVISNAVKYSAKSGKIVVKTELVAGTKRKTEVDEICIVETNLHKSETPSEFVEIIIEDTGIGIDKENIKEIFKRFYRVNNLQQQNIQGTGIGLFITKNMVKAHMGCLFVKSKKNKGSRFRILLPTGDKLLSPEQKSLKPVSKIRKNHLHVQMLTENDNRLHSNIDLNYNPPDLTDKSKHNIILIDDDIELNNYVSKHLLADFNVIQAKNGKSGWEQINKYEPDLIISDVMMPEMDGMELCTKVKTEISTSHIPLVLLTAKSEVDDFIEGLEIGADDYIAKPFNADILTAKIKSLIENRLKLRSLFSSIDKINISEIAPSETDSTFLQRVIEIVEKNIQDSDFDISRFTNEMFVSRSLLYKKLKALTNMSATEFVKTCRLKKAAKFLAGSNLNISEIAYETGFTDPKYFTRCFKKQFGSSPSEYKKRQMKKNTE